MFLNYVYFPVDWFAIKKNFRKTLTVLKKVLWAEENWNEKRWSAPLLNSGHKRTSTSVLRLVFRRSSRTVLRRIVLCTDNLSVFRRRGIGISDIPRHKPFPRRPYRRDSCTYCCVRPITLHARPAVGRNESVPERFGGAPRETARKRSRRRRHTFGSVRQPYKRPKHAVHSVIKSKSGRTKTVKSKTMSVHDNVFAMNVRASNAFVRRTLRRQTSLS